MLALNYKSVVGHGGGSSSSGSTPTEAPDSLQSTAQAAILDLISEGECEGFMNPTIEQSIKLDGTPLQNPDSTFNFTGVTVDYRMGTQDQDYIAGFGSVDNEVSVNTQFKVNTPLVRTITNPNVDSARILISVPSLVEQDSKGNIGGTSVQISIFVQTNEAGYQQVISDVITGKTRTKYQRQYAVALNGTGPWDIKVVRNTPDSTSSLLANDTTWDSYTEVVDAKLRYPNSCLIGLHFDATQFSSIPVRSFAMKLLKVQIPSNYDPITRVYTGFWDGTFKVAWTDNPAWCFYDMVTNARYGLGNYVEPALVDRWNLYNIAQYCDQIIPDGFGGTEPRFTMNLYLQTQEEAFKVLGNLASIFRSIIYWSAGLVTVSQDAPREPEYQYTNANVIDGRFTYSGSARLARHTVAMVTWNDPSDSYKQKVEYVEADDATIARYGVRETQIDAIGCTSRGQAHRFGKWALYSESLDTEVITFKTSLEATNAYPGMIIQTIDNNRAGRRAGGRVIAADANTVTLDSPITFENGNSYSITCIMPDGTLETQPFTGLTNPTSVVQLVAPFSHVPAQWSVWVVTATDLTPALWQVLGITRNDKITFEISALQYNPSKFGYIEEDLILVEPPTSIRAKNVPPVTNVEITQHSYTSPLGGVRLNLTISWDRPTTGQTYVAEYKQDSGNWIKFPATGDSAIDIADATPGKYVARVTAFNVLQLASIAAYSDPYNLVGKSDIPPGLASLLVYPGLWELDLYWTFVPNLGDILTTEIWVSKSNDRAQAELLGSRAYPIDSAINADLDNGDERWYWGRTLNTSDKYSDWYPLDPLGGVYGQTINDNTKIITMLSTAINGSNAGLSLKDQLDQLTDPGTGISSTVVDIQTDVQSLHTLVNSIGARLNAPNGDIANAISRIQAGAGVSLVTPHSATAPDNPVLGDAWYDDNLGGALKFWNGTDWVLASSAVVQSVAPDTPTVGELWKDTSTQYNYYRLWDGAQWIFTVRPTIYSASQPPTAGVALGDTWKDITDNELYVFNGTIWVDTQSTDVAAVAANITALQTTVAGHTTQIQQNINSIGGVVGLYSLKIDNNGHVAGFALSSTLLPGGTGAVSDFTVDVTRFSVGDSNLSAVKPFIVTNGQVYIEQAFIEDASIDTLKVAGQAIFAPVYMSNNGGFSLGYGVGDIKGQSLVQAAIRMPSGNSGVCITATTVIQSLNVGSDGPVGGNFVLAITRNDGVVVSQVNFTLAAGAISPFILTGLDNPPEGTWSYGLTCPGADLTFYGSPFGVGPCSILLLGAKR